MEKQCILLYVHTSTHIHTQETRLVAGGKCLTCPPHRLRTFRCRLDGCDETGMPCHACYVQCHARHKPQPPRKIPLGHPMSSRAASTEWLTKPGKRKQKRNANCDRLLQVQTVTYIIRTSYICIIQSKSKQSKLRGPNQAPNRQTPATAGSSAGLKVWGSHG